MNTRTITTARTRPRLVATVAAVAAALALWALAALAFGIEVNAPAMGDQPVQPIGPAQVAISSAAGALVGWGVLALLERFTARAHRIWLAVVVAGTLLSLGAPLTGAGIEAANRAVLATLHLAVATVLVPPLYRTSRDRG